MSVDRFEMRHILSPKPLSLITCLARCATGAKALRDCKMERCCQDTLRVIGNRLRVCDASYLASVHAVSPVICCHHSEETGSGADVQHFHAFATVPYVVHRLSQGRVVLGVLEIYKPCLLGHCSPRVSECQNTRKEKLTLSQSCSISAKELLK